MSASELPHDVEINILARLPVKNLLRFKAVCSLWRDTIESPQFIRQHLSHSTEHAERLLLQDFSSETASFFIAGRKVEPPVSAKSLLVYPCNGVLLLVRPSLKIMRLWNPSTGRSREIPFPPLNAGSHNQPIWGYRFLYDPVTGGFRIFGLLYGGYPAVKVLVFDSASGSDSWDTIHVPKSSGFVPILQTMETLAGARPSAFIHGGFHFVTGWWIVSLSPLTFARLRRRLAAPAEIRPILGRMNRRFVLTVSGGKLCLKVITDLSYEVWVMEEYGNDESWNRVSSVPLTDLLEDDDDHRCSKKRRSGVSTEFQLPPEFEVAGNGWQVRVRRNGTCSCACVYVRDIPSLPPQDVPMSNGYTIQYFTETLVTP